ncbi:TPA: hypothetical protein U1C34_000706 [Streptococcus suis]|nr:hypothetical protein [Streptococcus suis]HEM3621938.1 hypothetical protein [Streptococcus suis]
MGFSLFQTFPNLSEDLFVEVTWDKALSPEIDEDLEELVADLELTETLPYLTFYQTEVLFQSLKEHYQTFELSRISICHLEGGKPSSEGEVFSEPFVINQTYTNLLKPLMEVILTHPNFSDYPYSEKRDYFVGQVFPAYQASLGLSLTDLPDFPLEEPKKQGLSKQISNSKSIAKPSRASPSEQGKPVKKKVFGLFLIGMLSLASLGMALKSHYQLSKHSEQLEYLYQEGKQLRELVSTEHQIDVFSRYFLPNYYSGKKENLVDFLSDGDAKYTVPKEGTLQSVILEQLTYEPETKEYKPTYVLSVKEGDKTRSIRLSFTAKKSDSAKYGYVITTEPKESVYIKK